MTALVTKGHPTMPSNRAPARRRPEMPPPVDLSSLPTLRFADVANEGEAALIARGAAYVREYAAVEDKPTILLMNIATVLVALRSQHQTADGRTDWEGRSHAYRKAATEVYTMAGVPEDARERTSRAVRWHVGNILRETLTGAELEDYNLLPTSPLERLQDGRAERAAIVSAARAESDATAGAGAVTVRATADHIRLGQAVTNILGQLSTEVISGTMTDGQRAKLDAELADAQDKIRLLRRYTKKRSSGA